MDRFKLASSQKRAIFKAQFGKILLAQGFRFSRNRFIRFHKGQVLLSVNMEFSRTGNVDIRFGGMPMCIEYANPALNFGETVADFGRIYPLPENFRHLGFEDGCFDIQLELFRQHLLEPFAAVEDLSSLLDYQERILGDRLNLLPADWAAWECVALGDYEKAQRYALLWEQLAREDTDKCREYRLNEIISRDLSQHDRKIALRDHSYKCRMMEHNVYRPQRLVHLLEAGAHRLLRENIQIYTKAANAAFYRTYPDYKE